MTSMDQTRSVSSISSTDSLQAMVTFVRRGMGADLAVLFTADGVANAQPLTVDPRQTLSDFSLAAAKLGMIDWSNGPVDAAGLNIPSTIVAALGGPAGKVQFIAIPVEGAPRSGVLLMWKAENTPHYDDAFRTDIESGVRLLTTVFHQLLSDRTAAQARKVLAERFHDLFESVASGIVIFDNNGLEAIVNTNAATLLKLTPGQHEAFQIGAPMRKLRESCVNAAELAEIYHPLQSEIDYSTVALWNLGTRQFQVDTHPIRSDGHNGRIWLFHDVTAQHLVEQNLRRLAGTDPLTGLSNRRSFEELSDQLFAVAPTLTALMIDVDHFKSVNDTYGHAVGDQVLQTLSARCRTVLRGDDLMARLGGEEFVILMTGLNRESTLAMAERLRQVIGSTPMQTDAGDIEVRASIGVAIRSRGDANFDAMLHRADTALYQAKRTGRNRVVIDGEAEAGD